VNPPVETREWRLQFPSNPSKSFSYLVSFFNVLFGKKVKTPIIELSLFLAKKENLVSRISDKTIEAYRLVKNMK